MDIEDMLAQAEAIAALTRREPPDGRTAEVRVQLFGKARIVVSQPDSQYYDDGW